MKAHPRSRGDHLEVHRPMSAKRGSSPLARGPRPSEEYCGRRRGLIPARAGTTPTRRRCCARPRAHPRSRGDHPPPGGHPVAHRGSSPLARGPLADFKQSLAPVGLIPARAGTTRAWIRGMTILRAHPRSRGDHAGRGVRCLPPWGSSPLARGPLICRRGLDARQGLIPARAGTTFSSRSSFTPPKAHPRSRGDHRPPTDTPGYPAGSSPLARGPPRVSRILAACPGLIPARAGTTNSVGFSTKVSGAHPRSRGDHLRRIHPRVLALGSSPLARGPLRHR